MEAKTIYEKLAEIRVKLQESGLKQSGQNKFANFNYFELADILPKINEYCKEYKLATVFSATKETASLHLMDGASEIVFSVPFALPDIKGANDSQKMGGAITYSRRYLFLIAFEIVENDLFDATLCQEYNNAAERKPYALNSESKAVVKPEIEVMTILEALKAPINSVIGRLTGTLRYVSEKQTSTGKVITTYILQDKEDNQIGIEEWAKPRPNLVVGLIVDALEIKVKEYRNERQYTCKHIGASENAIPFGD
jgi:hypothetical protein